MRPNRTQSHTVGIHRLGLYWPACAISARTLAPVRGQDVQKLEKGLGVRSFAVPYPFEDAVTMAANAVTDLLSQGVDRASIGRLAVATESASDHAKPVAAWVHGCVGLGPTCEAFDVKFACVSGAYALLDALRIARDTGKEAIVVATDIAVYGSGSGSAEFTQGAAAVALHVRRDPDILAIDPDFTGTFTRDVDDFFRPAGRETAIVRGHRSVECYLDALAAVDDYLSRVKSGKSDDANRLGSGFDAMVFHAPYPALPRKALRKLLEKYPASESNRASLSAALEAALVPGSLLGNTYTASSLLALTALLCSPGGAAPVAQATDGAGKRRARSQGDSDQGAVTPHGPMFASASGARCGVYVYGSGSSSKVYCGVVNEKAPGALAHPYSMLRRLSDLRQLTVEEYESLFFAKKLPWPELPRPYRGFALSATAPDGYKTYARGQTGRRA